MTPQKIRDGSDWTWLIVLAFLCVPVVAGVLENNETSLREQIKNIAYLCRVNKIKCYDSLTKMPAYALVPRKGSTRLYTYTCDGAKGGVNLWKQGLEKNQTSTKLLTDPQHKTRNFRSKQRVLCFTSYQSQMGGEARSTMLSIIVRMVILPSEQRSRNYEQLDTLSLLQCGMSVVFLKGSTMKSLIKNKVFPYITILLKAISFLISSYYDLVTISRSALTMNVKQEHMKTGLSLVFIRPVELKWKDQ